MSQFVSIIIPCLVIIFGSQAAIAANILYLDGVPSPSHHIWNSALANALAARGHNITIISFSHDPQPMMNVTYIHLESGYEALYGQKEVKNDILKRHYQRGISAVLSSYKFGLLGCVGTVNSAGFQQLLDYPENFKFDIVMYDATGGPCLLGFAHKFQSKLITVSPFNTPHFSPQLVGGHKNFAYIPHFALSYTTDMNLWQRIVNFYVHIFEIIYRKWIHIPRIQSMVIDRYPKGTPNLAELERKTDLMFVNSHPVIDGSESLPPNVIQVGGLQISEKKKLPSDLSEFIESATKGAILFCMGTNFRTELLSHEEKEMFFKMIREMSDYHFLWKFDENYLNGFEIPPNLLVRTWMPQQEILAHPKTVGFVSHCGLLSTHEAHWFAVPIIGIPVYVDQHINCARVKKSKVGEVLPLMEMTANHTIEIVRRVVEMPIYRENMKKKSKIFRHQKELPIERAVWWTEWLLENSADHLKSPALEMGFFKSNSYDVMIIFFTAIFIIFKLLRALLQFIIIKCMNRPRKNIKRE